MHFWLDAIYRCGLREEYTMPLLEKWKTAVEECPMGLPEGFYKPEPSFRFDHSHAWGGTPAYAVPLALTGLEILQPGFGRIRLSPCLLGLKNAEVQIPAPQGMITVKLDSTRPPEVHLPRGIQLVTD